MDLNNKQVTKNEMWGYCITTIVFAIVGSGAIGFGDSIVKSVGAFLVFCALSLWVWLVVVAVKQDIIAELQTKG